MAEHGVLVLGLDGFDITFATPLIDAGELPVLRSLRDRGASFLLDLGPAARSGLAWEQFVTGLSMDTTKRSTVVELLPDEYDVDQLGVQFPPSLGSLDARVVVFDTPYTDLPSAPNTSGIVAWGAHDPGGPLTSNPPELRDELEAVVSYPSHRWTYASPWASVDATKEMGEALLAAIDSRCAAARWLLTERFPDWELAIVVTGEAHTAAEAFWHGVDPNHVVHGQPSAPVAYAALVDLYKGIDAMVGELIEATEPEAAIVFSMGGMGTNNADVTSMALLPELVYQWATGESRLRVPAAWSADPTAPAMLDEGQKWDDALAACLRPPRPRWRAMLSNPVTRRARAALRRTSSRPPDREDPLRWMPASRYRDRWPEMRAFGLPSYYDGRVRVNLEGREPAGLVPLDEYEAVLAELEALIEQCRDPRTGEPVARRISRAAGDPLALGPGDADLVVEWARPTYAFEHPTLGLIGPLPARRTGGHTGPHGFAMVAGEGIPPGDGGVRSSFDVNPTMATLLGQEPPSGVDGLPLVDPRPVAVRG